MNDDLQKQIAEILKQAVSAAQKGGEWIAGQIPDVLHQLIVWTAVQGAVALALEVALTICWVMFIPRHFRWVSAGSYRDDREFTYVPVGFAALGSAIFYACLTGYVFDGLKALVAPKLFLLEYAAHVLK